MSAPTPAAIRPSPHEPLPRSSSRTSLGDRAPCGPLRASRFSAICGGGPLVFEIVCPIDHRQHAIGVSKVFENHSGLAELTPQTHGSVLPKSGDVLAASVLANA